MPEKLTVRKPEIFISHRHKDEAIAKTLSDFIIKYTARQVDVFCSSDVSSKRPLVGRNLERQLALHLKECAVVLLIYTRPDEDWSYCMWECGVALDPNKNNELNELGATNIVVLQFSSQSPAPLNGLVRVDAKSVKSIKDFVQQLLTNAEFFPGNGGAITNYDPHEPLIEDAGKELYETLGKYQDSWESEHRWSVWPRMKLELDFQSEKTLKATNANVAEFVSSNVVVGDSDMEANRLFGVTSTQGRTLGDLCAEWKRANPQSDDAWIDFLITQIIRVINARSVDPNWQLLRTERRGTFVPIVLSCVRAPHEGKISLDVWFPEFSQTLEVSGTASQVPAASGIQQRRIRTSIGRDFQETVTGLRFLWIEGNEFLMGSDEIEPAAHASPRHKVRVSGFWLAETPVTRHQFQIYLNETGVRQPNYWQDDRFSEALQPVVGVSWEEAIEFCNWLAKETGLKITLPTEAQWEYAALGTNGNKYPWGDAHPDDSRACFAQDTRNGRPCPVGTFEAGRGPFGTLDQSGNVWEWCRDEWDESAYQKLGVDTTDPYVNNISTRWRALRGGGWDNAGEETKYLMPAYRMGNLKDIQHFAHGFRLAVIPENSI